ncbi:site-specific integrase [Candidatus Frankia alpina]|uniref:Site-specific integrase n=1 Tax=Candidatus Frankia alpina TaxID=2699483 RepID=A0A4S5ETC6_9ACTN|nr:site-specific integrase [Candidatus Frankia alpina]THJ75696.1 site-specific integrase [Candidatus Frankia alpina]
MKGSVYRKDGKWAYRHDLAPDPLTGKRRQSAKGGYATRKEADKALRDSITAAEKGRHVRASRRTVGAFLDEWHAARKASVRPTTWAKYGHLIRTSVNPIIGDTPLQELTPVRLNLLYAHLLDKGRVRPRGNQTAGLAPSTVATVHRMLRGALADAVTWDYVSRNAAEDARPPRVGRRRPTVWTPEQLRAFLAHIRGDRLYALYLLVVTTGMRRGEVTGLRREDVDLDSATVVPAVPRVVVEGRAVESETKTESGQRPRALDPVTLAALRAHITTWEANRTDFGHTNELLFCWPDGTQIHPDSVTDWFQRHARAAGLPVIRLHDGRHSYATAALKAGVHPKIVSERLGHADVAFTLKTYSHVIAGMDAAAASIVADVIFGPAETPDEDPVHESVHEPEGSPLSGEGEG